MRPVRAPLPSRPSPGAAGARLGELYTVHARMVHGICRLMLRDAPDAEDATQQVFLSAYRSLLVGTTVEREGSWLGTIARNECLGRIEVRMRTPLPTDELDTLVAPGVEEQAEGRANAAALYAELAILPPKQREAVVLRDLYGLRYDEVATALGTSRPAVEALLFRARRRLQHRLRPRLAAGVLVVPLAVHESLAYAVPGFSGAAAPVGAAGAIVAAPLLAKLAAGGAAVVLAGSAGVIVERGAHDRPAGLAPATAGAATSARPADRLIRPERSGAPIGEAERDPASAAGGVPVSEERRDDDGGRSGNSSSSGSEDRSTAPTGESGEHESGGESGKGEPAPGNESANGPTPDDEPEVNVVEPAEEEPEVDASEGTSGGAETDDRSGSGRASDGDSGESEAPQLG